MLNIFLFVCIISNYRHDTKLGVSKVIGREVCTGMCLRLSYAVNNEPCVCLGMLVFVAF